MPPPPLEPAVEPVKTNGKKKSRPKPAHMQGDVPINTNDLTGLPEMLTDAPPAVGDFSVVIRATQMEPKACPYCRCDTKQFLPSNGTRGKTKQRLYDEPHGFRRVIIEVTRRNFKCEGCGARGLLPLWGVGERQRQTDRLASVTSSICRCSDLTPRSR